MFGPLIAQLNEPLTIPRRRIFSEEILFIWNERMGLSQSDYERDRFPRYGTANPERVDSVLWRQLLAGDLEGARTHGHFNYDGHWSRLNNDYTSIRRSDRPGPRWSGRGRYGQSRTLLPDGRMISIGGTFEDFYDPDFCIYNDVIVRKTNGKFDIYLYPREIFPPTDFHSATRIEHWLYLIGGLGYMDLRRPGETQVWRLHTKTFVIEALEIAGHAPGWIYDHTATYVREDHSIDLSGGHLMVSAKDTEPFQGPVSLDIEMRCWC